MAVGDTSLAWKIHVFNDAGLNGAGMVPFQAFEKDPDLLLRNIVVEDLARMMFHNPSSNASVELSLCEVLETPIPDELDLSELSQEERDDLIFMEPQHEVVMSGSPDLSAFSLEVTPETLAEGLAISKDNAIIADARAMAETFEQPETIPE